jgi:hypothetical protein
VRRNARQVRFGLFVLEQHTMNRKKFLFASLIIVNVALFAIIILMWKRHLGQTKETALSVGKFAALGANTTAILNNLFAQSSAEDKATNFKNVVFLFFSDSAGTHVVEYANTLQQAMKDFPVFSGRVLILCPQIEEMESNEIKHGETFSIVLFDDSKERLRWKWGMTRSATILVDGATNEIVASYPYILNPYVLCEQLQKRYL